MKSKSWRQVGKILILAVVVASIILTAAGCVSGLTPIGWSGGTISDDTLYVGSSKGLVAISLTSDTKSFSEQLKAPAQTGLFGCSSTGGGCSGGAAGVAIYGSPVIYTDKVIIATYTGKVYSFFADTLQINKEYPVSKYLDSIVGSMILDQGYIYFGCSDGKVYALDAETFKEKWVVSLGDTGKNEKIWATPAIDGDTLYIGSFDKKLYALNISDGSEKWSVPVGGAIITTPLVDNGTVYFGSFDRNLYAVKADDGKEIWTFTGNNWFWAKPIIHNGTIYAACLDGYFYLIDSQTGKEISGYDKEEFKHGAVASTPVIVDNYVVFATKKPGVLYKVDTDSYEITKVTELDMQVDGPLTAYKGDVYIHGQGSILMKVNVANGSMTLISLQETK